MRTTRTPNTTTAQRQHDLSSLIVDSFSQAARRLAAALRFSRRWCALRACKDTPLTLCAFYSLCTLHSPQTSLHVQPSVPDSGAPRLVSCWTAPTGLSCTHLARPPMRGAQAVIRRRAERRPPTRAAYHPALVPPCPLWAVTALGLVCRPGPVSAFVVCPASSWSGRHTYRMPRWKGMPSRHGRGAIKLHDHRLCLAITTPL